MNTVYVKLNKSLKIVQMYYRRIKLHHKYGIMNSIYDFETVFIYFICLLD